MQPSMPPLVLAPRLTWLNPRVKDKKKRKEKQARAEAMRIDKWVASLEVKEGAADADGGIEGGGEGSSRQRASGDGGGGHVPATPSAAPLAMPPPVPGSAANAAAPPALPPPAPGSGTAPPRKRKQSGVAKQPDKIPAKYRGPCCLGFKEWGVKDSDGPGDLQPNGSREWYCYACMYILDKPA